MVNAGVKTQALANAIGVSYQAVKKVLDGKSKAFDAENNSKAAAFLNVNPDWLARGQGEMFAPAVLSGNGAAAALQQAATTGLRVPVMANAASMGAGEDAQFEDVMAGALTLSPQWVGDTLRPSRPEALRFIHGYGDSMSPTFASGDVLLVDTGVREVRIDGIYVLSAHNRLFIKRVRQRLDGHYEISSDNPTHKTVDTLNGDHSVDVLGRVIWAWNGRRV